MYKVQEGRGAGFHREDHSGVGSVMDTKRGVLNEAERFVLEIMAFIMEVLREGSAERGVSLLNGGMLF